ncbi:MAG TPA: ATP-binding protein, partial [Rhodocyclaceae bacterium]|nr:ATP-binding protein [Rhodocyclaceae bacterium]
MNPRSLLLRSPFRSLRQFLAAFVLVVVLPGLLLASIQTWLVAKQLVEGPEREARGLAASAAESMGNHLRTMTESAAVFSHMPLGKEQYASFYKIAKGFSGQVGYFVTLADADGNQFLSTRAPFGTPVPRRSAMDSVHKAVASGHPHVSDLFPGKLIGIKIITVDVPVQTAEGLRIITLTSTAAAMSDVLLRTAAPKGWLFGMIDGNGIFIARSKDPGQWVGKAARPELIAAARNSPDGVIRNKSAEGFPILNVFHRVPGTDWTVLVGIPNSVLYAPLAWPLGMLAGAIALTIMLTALLAFLFVRQLNAAINTLIGVARDPLHSSVEIRNRPPSKEPPRLTDSFYEFEEITNVLQMVALKRQRLADALDQSAELSAANSALTQEVEERRRAEEALQEEKALQRALIKRLEEAQSQLLQSEKMASIGLLAAGMAHEINNPIGFVSGNVSTLSEYTDDMLAVLAAYERSVDSLLSDHPDKLADIVAARKGADLDYLREDVPKLLQETRDGIQRVLNIVTDLKEFSRVGETMWQLSDLHKGMNSTLNMVWNEVKYKAQVVKEYGDIPLVECVASQINQVFLNLLINASHAIVEKGVITLRSGQRGDQVWIEVTDTGTGIAPENLTRIFDPFFTTKPVGTGTGLGLSVSYGIVHRHGGKIEVESELGKGTVFRIWLPINQAKSDVDEADDADDAND